MGRTNDPGEDEIKTAQQVAFLVRWMIVEGD
jgi:hypothetical protein